MTPTTSALPATPIAMVGARPLATAEQGQTPRVDPRSVETMREFEAVLIGELTNIMMSTVPTDPITGGGSAEQVYRSMMGEKIGQEISKRGGIGLMPALMDELIRLQGGQP